MSSKGGDRWSIPEGLREAGLGSWYALGLLIGVVGLLAVFAILRTVTIPLVLGVLFGIVAFPLTDYLARHRIKRVLAGILVSLLFVAVFLGIGYLVLNELVGQGQVIAENLNKAAADVESAAGEDSAVANAVASITQSVQDNWKDLLAGLVPVVGGRSRASPFWRSSVSSPSTCSSSSSSTAAPTSTGRLGI